MPVKPPDAPTKLVPEFTMEKATIRGTKYVLKELDAQTYEDCIKKSTGDDGMVDQSLMIRLMLDKALVEPDMDVKEIFRKPYSVVRKLEQIVNDIHFADVTTEEEEEEESKGEAKG